MKVNSWLLKPSHDRCNLLLMTPAYSTVFYLCSRSMTRTRLHLNEHHTTYVIFWGCMVCRCIDLHVGMHLISKSCWLLLLDFLVGYWSVNHSIFVRMIVDFTASTCPGMSYAMTLGVFRHIANAFRRNTTGCCSTYSHAIRRGITACLSSHVLQYKGS